MSIFVYKLPEFLLNSWTNFETTQNDVANIEADEQFMQPWRDEVAARLEEGGELLRTIGWDGEFDPETDLWFGPLPVASLLSLSAYLIAIRAADAVYILSPYDLPWLAAGALAKATSLENGTPQRSAIH